MHDAVIIDVREKDEFASEHIEKAINVPLSMFANTAHGLFHQLAGKKIIIMCNTGARATQAKSIAQGLELSNTPHCEVFEGGLHQWKKSGRPIVRKHSEAPLPLMRQVQLTVGIAIVLFCLLALTVSPVFIYAAAAFGAGLILAGITGLCPLANLIAKMPWNTRSRCS